jgi:hypothetical protein
MCLEEQLEDVMRAAQERFIHAQGFRAGSIDFYRALRFQPKIVGSLVLIGAWLGSAWFFLILSVAMWWSTLAPTRNVFDAIYNSIVACPRRLPPLAPAPAPRRFALGMAATFALLTAGALFLRASVIAWAFEAVCLVAVLAVLAGDFCLGAWVYHLHLLERINPRDRKVVAAPQRQRHARQTFARSTGIARGAGPSARRRS